LAFTIVRVASGGIPAVESDTGFPYYEADNGYGIPVTFGGSGIPLGGAMPPGFKALLDAMAVQPSASVKSYMQRLYSRLYSAQVLQNVDGFYVTAQALEQQACLNWSAPGTYTLAAANSPVFTPFGGIASDFSGSSATTKGHYDTGIEASTAAKFKLNNHTFGCYVQTDVAQDSTVVMGVTNAQIQPQTSTFTARLRSGSTTTDAFTHKDSRGLMTVNRASSSAYSFYRGDMPVSVNIARNTISVSGTFWLCGWNAASPQQYSTRPLLTAHVGASLTYAQITEMNAAIEEYLVAVGSIPGVRGLWAGAVYPDGFTAAGDQYGSGSSTLLVASDSAGANVIYESAAVAAQTETTEFGTSYYPVKQSVSAPGILLPDTAYYYNFKKVGGQKPAAGWQRIKTFPAATSPFNGRITLVSCTNVNTNTDVPALKSIENDDPRLLLHMGDFTYADPADGTDFTNNDTLTRKGRRVPNYASLFSKVPVAYMFDNHDSSNDHGSWDQTYLNGLTHAQNMALLQATYDKNVPCYPYAETSNRKTCTQFFNIGSRIRVGLLDTRAQTISGSGTKTILGIGTNPPGSWDQLSAVKADMLAAQAAGKRVYFFVTPRAWSYNDSADHWGTYPTEQNGLTAWWAANLTTMEVIILTGDVHYSGFSDGAGMPGGYKVIQSSPLYNTGSSIYATYAGMFTVGGVVKETYNASLASQYTNLDVTDTGSTMTLDFTCKGSPIDGSFNPTTTMTAQFVLS
jgi:hypothetical protein